MFEVGTHEPLRAANCIKNATSQDSLNSPTLSSQKRLLNFQWQPTVYRHYITQSVYFQTENITVHT